MKLLEDDLFQKKMQEKVTEIEAVLKEFLPKEMSEQKTIFQAMEYSLMAGGKRLRPMLLQESYELFGGKEKEVVHAFMAAMEMIHTYSLVHDDLPAMDNDDYRRGKETTHRVFGEDMGILAGDALLNYAYETAVSGVERLDFIYRLKTGALLEAALMAGAALAGAGKKELCSLEEIGRNVGMAFQIQDDILDLTSTTKELGKPVLSDAKNEKTTYVSLYGMEKAKYAVEEYSNQALKKLTGLPAESAYLNTLIVKLIHRKK